MSSPPVAAPSGAAERVRTVLIWLFEVEVLDFAGPWEVFSVTRLPDGSQPFRVLTVAESLEPVRARNGLRVLPHDTLDDAPAAELVVVPGGFGTRREMHNPRVHAWLRERDRGAELMLSVCTGSLVLARAGLLAGHAATTHHATFDMLEETAPDIEVRRGALFVDTGRIITSAGISAGIDMSLHVVARLHGAEVARHGGVHGVRLGGMRWKVAAAPRDQRRT